ncbi:MAG TPA: TIGR04283 family arsenosugar biosynthesis glycosyltransferase [Gammaproteobacteria bacterium]
MSPYLSLIIPVLNEADGIHAALQQLQPLRARGHEVILVDGGSTDGTTALAADLTDKIITTRPGRAAQMNSGAAAARGQVLLFLHADTRLPDDCEHLLAATLGDVPEGWGRFNVQLSGDHGLFRIIGFCINLRSRLSGIATGDQAIFVSRGLFVKAGGYPQIALMEDIALSKKLLTYQRPHCLSARVVTSSRRWRQYGILKTILLMWWLRARYFFGTDPEQLAKAYYKKSM